MVLIGNAHSYGMITNNTGRNNVYYYFIRRFFMPKNKFQDAVFTLIMATIMVYGIDCLQCCAEHGRSTGRDISGSTSWDADHGPAAFILEFFVVGKLARRLAFTVMRPADRPQFITYAISICICCIMCPTMSLIATILFKDTKDFGTWIQTWAMNFPMAILYQMFYCGPLVRFIFRMIFEKKDK